MIRAEADFQFNVRARKGERKGPGGRLIKCQIFRGCENVAAAIAEVAAAKEVMKEAAECIAVAYYDEAAFTAWARGAGGEIPKPLYTTKG